MFFQKVKLSFLKAEVIANAVAEKYQTRITTVVNLFYIFLLIIKMYIENRNFITKTYCEKKNKLKSK